MDNNTIEIRDDEINVEEIMAKIRENIRRRQAAGELPPDPDTLIGASPCSYTGSNFDGSLRQDLSYISSNWDIRNKSYFISSHHPYLGRMLVKGRQLVHGEVRRYVDPMFSRQAEFNRNTVGLFNQILQQGEELNQKILQQGEELNAHIQNSVEVKLDNIFSRVDRDIQLRLGLVHILEERMQKEIEQKSTIPESTSADTNYLLFEERFRGSREIIKQRQLAFLPYFENCTHVLDIGCGRGEFLEILKDYNINGTGVDLDADMVAYCRSHQLNVEQSDAIAYLEKLEDESLDGIFMDQVVEHVDPGYLIKLITLCYQKLIYGGHIVIETVNPLSLVAFFNFYLDISHKKPIHPYTLKFLLDSCQFTKSEIKYYSEIPENAKLRKMNRSSTINKSEQEFLEVYDYNIDMLNLLLWGPMDYAIIGEK